MRPHRWQRALPHKGPQREVETRVVQPALRDARHPWLSQDFPNMRGIAEHPASVGSELKLLKASTIPVRVCARRSHAGRFCAHNVRQQTTAPWCADRLCYRADQAHNIRRNCLEIAFDGRASFP
jgi:hypothetical protein